MKSKISGFAANISRFAVSERWDVYVRIEKIGDGEETF
jgi:hypothetical protein